ncbi:DUF386 domain-containing protein [Pedobacter sp. BS3]|uniref:YhcH/YjgK/YiaL family protein n=1 Tax=Pedobacter sp. BS3 TaxID=2567937 RepID=UPI0011F0173A|nr:YhcH/YjgK/YiaL family protein [Pedobacter sp. BS3]TZF82547.1 DUF386 domain-containing protein [Pedobacter sp. BS3]
MKRIFKAAFVLMLLLYTGVYAQTPSKENWTKRSARKWVKSGEWKNGLKLNVYSDVDAEEFARQYHANKVWWDKAFAYLRDNDLANLPNGKVQLDGDDVTVSVTESATKPFEKTGWESHRKFIDLQYIVRGKEGIIAADTAKLTVTDPYNEKKDVAHYAGDGKKYIAEPGTFYLFFPADAHRPVIHVDGYDVVKKVVIKIRYTGMK